MRLWSIHPEYLDSKGLVALWREALLAQNVLGNTRGYFNHPQLIRFRQKPDPLRSIGNYLHSVFLEAERRGYKFDHSKIQVLGNLFLHPSFTTTKGGIEHWERI